MRRVVPPNYDPHRLPSGFCLPKVEAPTQVMNLQPLHFLTPQKKFRSSIDRRGVTDQASHITAHPVHEHKKSSHRDDHSDEHEVKVGGPRNVENRGNWRREAAINETGSEADEEPKSSSGHGRDHHILHSNRARLHLEEADPTWRTHPREPYDSAKPPTQSEVESRQPTSTVPNTLACPLDSHHLFPSAEAPVCITISSAGPGAPHRRPED